MKKKHIIYTLSTIPLAITLGNVNDSNAFFGLDSFISKNKTVSDIVNIRDNNLLKAINKQLGRGEVLDRVTIDDMERLIVLNAESKNISSIEGLEYAVNLVELRLYNNNISNIEPLKDLVNLEILHIGKNNISSLEALKKLTNLKKLYFHGNKVSSVEPLRNLIQLTTLHIGDGYYINGQWYDFKNNVTDISPLANLTKLKYLRLENNQVSDISALSNLVNLNELYLYRNKVVDITPLSGLINLKNLRLNENQISSVSALSNMTNLNELYLSENRITDITPLSGLINLKELRLHFNQISNISALSNLTNLNNLWLGANQISDISPLSNLSNLKDLRLGKNQISNISALSNLTNLSFLQLNNNQVSDISILNNLTKLNTLYLNHNQISDISPISNLINLVELHLESNQILSVSPLKNLINLTNLYLHNNQILDITDLGNLTKLTALYLNNNQISDISSVNNLINLKTLVLYYNQISDISPLSSLDKLERIDLGYNEVIDFSTISNLYNLRELYLHNNRIFDISSISSFKGLTKVRLDIQKPIIEAGDFKSKTDKLDVSTNNPIIGLNNKNLNISSISNSGIYENGKLKWNIVPLGSHVRTFNFSENVTVGSASTTFNGTATLNFSVVDGGAPESDHTSDFDNSDFGIYATVTANDLGEGVSHLIHKGVRQSLPYRFKYDILEPANNMVEVYDLAGNKADYEVKLKDNDIPAIEEGMDALINKVSVEKEDISYFRTIINDLDESMNKDLLQDRLNDVYPNTLELERKSVTSNVDVYIKSENILQMSLDTNSITFEDFSGVKDMIKENAVEISINSSLPYSLNAYLPTEIQNSDKSNTMDKDILNIKENGESTYQAFANTTDKVVLKDNCPSGNDLVHGVDIKLSGGIAHEKDVYKTTIKFEAEQK